MNAPLPAETVDEWVAGYLLHFADGESLAKVCLAGTFEKCAHFSNLLPGLAYSGDKPVKSAQSFVMRKTDWETL